MFWLCIYHGLRQNERKFLTFYLPKLIVILPMWLCAIVLATWEKYNELRDPTYNHFVDTGNYQVFRRNHSFIEDVLALRIAIFILIFYDWDFLQGFRTFFYISCAMYLLYLALLILKAYSELRSMPFFGKKYNFFLYQTIVAKKKIKNSE